MLVHWLAMLAGDDPDSLRARGLSALRAGRYDDARELFERALAQAPDDPALHSNLGSAWHLQGELDRAFAAHGRALALVRAANPPDAAQMAWCHYNLGAVNDALGRLDEARAAYERALAARPDTPAAIENLGTVLQRLGDLDGAERAYRELIERAPERVSAHRNLGSVLCAAARLDDAGIAYRRACTLAPHDPACWLDLGAVEQARADGPATIDAYRRACELAPDSAEAHVRLGAALLRAGRLESAEATHRRALTLAPESASTHNALGATLVGRARYADAIAHLRRAVQLDPAWPQPRYNLGVALHYSSLLTEAVDAYRSVVDRSPSALSAWKNLADCQRQLGRYQQARATYQRILSLDPDDVSARYLMAALAAADTSDAASDAPPSPPAEYIRRLFDDYAPRFDDHLQGALKYRMPAAAAQAVTQLLDGAKLASALDLGCGTGLVGAELRPLTDSLHGVDLSSEMVARARKRAVYDQLFTDELSVLLADHDRGLSRYQLIAALDVLIYVGELDPLFALVSARLSAPGWFLFTIEEREAQARDRPGWSLQPTGRYTHSRTYIAQLAALHDLHVESDRAVTVRTEHEQPVAGALYILTKDALPTPSG